jgi:hypothetical protein
VLSARRRRGIRTLGHTVRTLALGATVVGLAVLALAGCETTAEKSALLAKKFHRVTISQRGLQITHASRTVKVLDATLVHDANGTAAVITLRNNGAKALRELPIALTLKGPSGRVVFQNNGPGLDPSLTSMPLLLAHQTSVWVDDQLPGNTFPASVTAVVGEAPISRGSPPRLRIVGQRLAEDPTEGASVQGTLINNSPVTQQDLVVAALARRAGKVVAAGRALLSSVPANSSSAFQVFLIGDPSGAKLELSAPPSSLR